MSGAISTDREVYALKSESARYERAVTKARGLSILVYPNGTKTFVVRYVAPSGSRRRLVLGDYPGLSLVDAREKAGALRVDIVAGKDPVGERTAAKVEARFGETLDELADRYWKAAAIGLHGGRRRPLRPETLERQKALWKRHLKPVLGNHRFKEMRRADVRQFMQNLVVKSELSASSISSVGDVIRALFTYALSEDLVEANPTAGLTRPVTPESRSRMFDDAGLAKIMKALADACSGDEGREDPHARMSATTALAIQFLILTLTRRTETAGASWSEFDLDTKVWIIPGARTKNRQTHVVPLSAQSLEVLALARALPAYADGGFVFPAHSDPAKHLDAHAITRAVSRLCTRLKLPPGSPHDFRRSGATTLTGERHQIRRFIVGKVLGHTATTEGPAVTSVYDRNEYLPEKRIALDAWGRHIEGLRQRPAPARPKGRVLRLVGAN